MKLKGLIVTPLHFLLIASVILKLAACNTDSPVEPSIDDEIFKYDRSHLLSLIKDRNLRIAVYKQIFSMKSGTAPEYISMEDFEKIFYLNVSQKNISNLQGIQYCRNLAILDISSNPINDLSPLSSLKKLSDLYINSCRLKDISALASNTSLQTLSADINEIAGISALSSLHNLRTLSLMVNKINNISPLENLNNLQNVNLRVNSIEDISPLMNKKRLKFLDVDGNRIKGELDLSQLTELVSLEAVINQITKVTGVADTINLNTI